MRVFAKFSDPIANYWAVNFEMFGSVTDAVSALRERRDHGGRFACNVLTVVLHDDETPELRSDSVMFPSISERAFMDLYFVPTEKSPFMHLSFGPRGGVQRKYTRGK